MAVNAINNAAHMVIDSDMSYDDFVIIQKDANCCGNIYRHAWDWQNKWNCCFYVYINTVSCLVDAFVIIQKDANDKIQFVQSNTVKINRLTRDLANLCQSNIEKIEQQSIQIPLGAFTGSVIMSDLGPPVNIALLPIHPLNKQCWRFLDKLGMTRYRLWMTCDRLK